MASNNPFVKATKEKAFLKLALVGISGSGKTYSALNIAQHLVPDCKIAVVDTEHGSASKYADIFNFDAVNLENAQPKAYVDFIRAAAANGYDVVILDSLTHAWDALLSMKDKVSGQRGENSFTAWMKVNPHYNALIDAILGTPIHVIGTIRAKSDFIMEEYTKSDGSKGEKPVKVGMKAVQRDGFEYEFDVVANMDLENTLIVEKTRCPALHGEVISKPGKEIADVLRAWLSDGVDPVVNTVHVDEHGEVVLPPQAQPGDPDYKLTQPRTRAQREVTPPPAPDARNDGQIDTDDYPTINTLWPDVAKSLLVKKVSELPKGLTIGGIIYPVATTRLGYEDDNAVKHTLALGSLNEFVGTVETLMARVIELSPVVANS